ncbi:MAG: hypothetical protein SGILL_003474, partial [Bacillariaceae sp.]
EIFCQGKSKNARQRAVLLEQVEGIRQQVSLEMCHQTPTGQQLLSLQQQQPNQNGGEVYKPLVPGVSTSALRLKNIQNERVSSKKAQHTISTGCRSLDDLISFPKEYEMSSTYREEWNVVGAEGLEDDTGAPNQQGGWPRGYVMSLTGKTGKTQLCLQLAAQACRQSGQGVRYCYSTAGHSQHSLAKRVKELIGAISTDRRDKHERMKLIEFVPISNSTQLSMALAELEAEWMQQKQQAQENHRTGEIAMLVLDSLPLMLVDKEEHKTSYLERWLKRMARQHAVWIVVTGVSPTSAAPLNTADIQLQLSPGASSLTNNIQLVRHQAKFVTNQDRISLVNTPDFGMTTPE